MECFGCVPMMLKQGGRTIELMSKTRVIDLIREHCNFRFQSLNQNLSCLRRELSKANEEIKVLSGHGVGI